jgi:hypothetical protein
MHLRLSTLNPEMMQAGLLFFLRQLSSPELWTIHFDTNVTIGHLDLPWDEVDAALEVFGALQELVFDLYGFVDVVAGERLVVHAVPYPSYAELCQGMRSKMRSSDARGILKFKCAGTLREQGVDEL